MSKIRIFGCKDEEKPVTKKTFKPTADSKGYGLENKDCYLISGDYGFSAPLPFERVYLINPSDCSGVNLDDLIIVWKKGVRHMEWAAVLAIAFIEAVSKANAAGNSEADISFLFTREMSAKRGRIFSQKAIYNHIIPWFDIMEIENNVMKVRFRIET